MVRPYRYLAHHYANYADLYGRGYSDAPQTTYDATLYTVQLALLMQHLRWDKAIVAGVSMVRSPRTPLRAVLTFLQGGGIAATFTAQFPHLVDDKVVLIACAGLVEVRFFFYPGAVTVLTP